MVHTEWICLPVDDGEMAGYLARPDGDGPWPGVLVFMEIFGVNAHIRDITERVAAQGYVALALNYYHRTTENLELGYSARDVVEGRRHKEQTTRKGILQDVQTGLCYLKASDHVAPKTSFGTLGFCFGGHVGYIAATLPEIKATALFYGAGIATTSPGGGAPTVTHTGEIDGEVLALFGADDVLIPLPDVETIRTALTKADVPHDVEVYEGVGHGFFCDQRPDYDADAAKDAWQKVLALFERRLGS